MFNLIPWRNGNIANRKDDWFGLDRFFDEFFRDPFFAKVSSMTAPIRADIRETDKEYIVEAEMPGLNKEDIIIDLNNDVLTLGADIKKEVNDEKDGYIYRERQSGSFRRSFRVENIKNEDVKASYHNGILTVILPKSDDAAKSRRIAIE